MNVNHDVVRIGCGAGFWGDSPMGSAQLVKLGGLDYLVLEYLAEITMALLSRARDRDATQGFVPDFVSCLSKLAPEIDRQGIKVVTNAGGINPRGCRDALSEELAKQGVALTIAVVLGDDLLQAEADFPAQDVAELRRLDTPLAKPSSANVYLGAKPIAAALKAGADIVITGRCVDSALTLGPLMHEFGWDSNDWDRLAAGSLAGHILECGTQATGGLFTDWELIADDWGEMGFPIAECQAGGDFVLTKPEGTGGLVSAATIAEQIIYEVGDPGGYLLPDVVCDFRHVNLREVGPNRVEVTGAAGYPAPSTYKVMATYQDGYRSTGTMMIVGRDAAKKAERVGAAILKRSSRVLKEQGLTDFKRVDVEVLGAESSYGPHARARDSREVVLKVAVHHDERTGPEVFAKEFLPSATSMAQGITGFAGGRPAISPLIRVLPSSVLQSEIPIIVEMEGAEIVCEPGAERSDNVVGSTESSAKPSPVGHSDEFAIESPVHVPLLQLAHGRSGDKGDSTNIGILARDPAYLPAIRSALTAEVVRGYFAHMCDGKVTRYEWPGLNGFNFLLEQSLGGGGTASLRYDPQGKAYAQMLLDIEIAVPGSWVSGDRPLINASHPEA